MESISLGALVDGLDGCVHETSTVESRQNVPISGIEYDSRGVYPGCLFVCIEGEKADGHDFAAQAVASGAVALAVEHVLPLEVPQVVFEDTRTALALLASRYYKDPSSDIRVAAVTGTNGKTTTTYLIEWICRFALADASGGKIDDAVPSTGLIGTVETRIGKNKLPSKHTTPESSDLQRLFSEMRECKVSHASMEVSSHAVELKRVAGVHFAVAAFTNLTQDHLDFHGSMEKYFDAKAALFEPETVKARAIDIDTDYGKRLYDRVLRCGYTATTCGLSPDATVRAENVEYGTDKTTIRLITPEGSYALTYPLIGAFNVSNVLLAATSASLLGFEWPVIVRALERCPQIPGRMEHVEVSTLENDIDASALPDVFVDYSHTPDSIEKAVHALSEVKTGRLLIVFGCGGDRDKTKRPL
ncbi:MAG TPA: UDP-N-acetylmuramoyl-L-alanyl-D-glutamate--2,6-diaminopimelate ligase, partial [Coriobacteriia bacterium]|nr:UDP-N-acetylmuramoyl-L-alanyl-D-glutamate--2,6-diaminopimelate ligase [Coriobacteriia bacterium]